MCYTYRNSFDIPFGSFVQRFVCVHRIAVAAVVGGGIVDVVGTHVDVCSVDDTAVQHFVSVAVVVFVVVVTGLLLWNANRRR